MTFREDDVAYLGIQSIEFTWNVMSKIVINQSRLSMEPRIGSLSAEEPTRWKLTFKQLFSMLAWMVTTMMFVGLSDSVTSQVDTGPSSLQSPSHEGCTVPNVESNVFTSNIPSFICPGTKPGCRLARRMCTIRPDVCCELSRQIKTPSKHLYAVLRGKLE